MNNVIFLDVDGVLTDWVKACKEWLDIDLSGVRDYVIDYPKYGFTFKTFWRALDHIEFWRDMPPTPESKYLLDRLYSYRPVILSKVTMPNAIYGRLLWIKENLPLFFNQGRYWLGHEKKYLARPGALLIDDREDNINNWIDMSGDGMLWPAPWNSLYYIESFEDKIKYFETKWDEWISKIARGE